MYICCSLHIEDSNTLCFLFKYHHIYIYIYTSVDLRISILVSDDTESRQAELSGAGTVFSNSFFE